MSRPMRTFCLFIAGALLALWVFPLCSRVKNPQKTDQIPDVTPPVVHVLTAFPDTVYLDTLSFSGTAFDSSGLKIVIGYARSDTDTAVFTDSTWEIDALSLLPGKDSVHLRFTDSAGNSADTLLAVLYYEVTPAAPTNLALDVYDRQFVRVRWKDNAQTEEGFNIWRSVDGLDWVFAGETEADKISYIDTTRLSSDTIYYYTVNAFNAAGISGKIPHRGITLTRLISVDSIPPSIRFVSPHSGDSLGTDSVLVLLSIVDSNGVSSVRINDSVATILGNYWVRKEPLATGQNWFVARATDRSGNVSYDSIAVYYGANVPDRNGPLVTFISPRQNDTVSAANLMLSGTAIDPSGIGSITVDDSGAALLNELNWRMPLVLHNGTNRIRVSVTDRLRNPTDTVLVLVLDTNHVDNISPVLQVLSPQPFDTVRTDTVTFMGAVFDPSGVCSVLVNSVPASLEMLSWRATIPLTKGWDTITIEAFDSSALRNRTVQRLYVLRNNAPLFLETGTPRDTLLYRGDVYRASLNALDPNDDPISFSLVRPPSPQAAILNPQSGSLEWTPANKGEYRMLAYVWDGDEADTAKWTVMVGANAPAFVPSQLAMLPTTDTVGRQYKASLQAYDRDGLDGLVFKLLQAPSYVNLDSTSGQISWDVVFEDTGAHAFSAVVRDPEGLSDTVSWQVHVVLGEIKSPQFTTASRSIPTSDTVGQTYRVDLNGTDALPLTLSYSLAVKPAGMQIDSSGVITWTPVAADTGAREVKAIVRNSQNREDTLSWTIHVHKNRLPPVFGAATAVDTVLAGYPYTKLLTATHFWSEQITYFWTQRPSPNLDLNSSTGLVSWVPAASYGDSIYSVAAICTSLSGLSDTLSWSLFVADRSPRFVTTPGSLPNSDTAKGQNYLANLVAADDFPGDLSYSLVSPYPSGLSISTISRTTAQVTWASDSSHISGSPHTIKAVVTNTHNRSDTISWSLRILRDDLAPAFTTTDLADTAFAESAFTKTIVATHPYANRPYKETLTFALLNDTLGGNTVTKLTDTTARVDWTPQWPHIRTNTIAVRVSTVAGLSDTLTWTVHVPNRPPVIGAVDTSGTYFRNHTWRGIGNSWSIPATDADGEALTYSVLSPTSGTGLPVFADSTIGTLTWTLGATDSLGYRKVKIQTMDQHGGADTLSWNVLCGDTSLWNSGLVQIPAGSFYRGDTISWLPETDSTLNMWAADVGDEQNQLARYSTITGISAANSEVVGDTFRQYIAISADDSVFIYKNSARTQLVGAARCAAQGQANIVVKNASGLGGSLFVTSLGSADNNIIVNYIKSYYHDFADQIAYGYPDLPVHRVTLTQSYWMNAAEITYREFAQYKNGHNNGSGTPADSSFPATNMSQSECYGYCNWLSKQHGLDTCYVDTCGNPVSPCYRTDFTRNGYRLPTEAEWEQAARGMQAAPKRFPWGNATASGTIGLYENFSGSMQAVKQRQPVSYGLYDLLGNVFERCNDGYSDYPTSDLTDPRPASAGLYYVYRGGYYLNTSATSWKKYRSAYRFYTEAAPNAYVGFRIVRIPYGIE